jgi:hypothetical protein
MALIPAPRKVHLARSAGLGREEQTKVTARSAVGEGGATQGGVSGFLKRRPDVLSTVFTSFQGFHRLA